MRHNTHSLSISLCASLIVHLLGFSAVALWFALSTPPPKLAAIDRNQVIIRQITREMAQPPKPRVNPVPPAPKLPLPPPQFPRPNDTLKDDSGEHNGVGTANRSSKGDQPMQARQGLEQADLMKPDAKDFNPDSSTPASAGKNDQSIASPPQPSKAGRVTPDFTAQSDGGDQPADPGALALLTTNGSRPVPRIVQPKPVNPAPSGETHPDDKKTNEKNSSHPPSALKEVRGRRAQISDTDSSAFASVPSTTFKNGKLEGRKGLKVKTTPPRFSDSSYVDLNALGAARVELGVRVDEDGNVLNVTLLQSSGSTNVDNDCITAVWNWTLEPQKDSSGKVTDDLWRIAID